MGDVETKKFRMNAIEVILAALEGRAVTYSRAVVDPESPESTKTINYVIEFCENPQQVADAIKQNPAIQNRLGDKYEEFPELLPEELQDEGI